MIDIENIKRQFIHIPEILNALDIQHKKNGTGYMIRCLWHDDKNPSCSVTIGEEGTLRTHCFSCGHTGDIIDLISASCGCDFMQAVDMMQNMKIIQPQKKEYHKDIIGTWNSHTSSNGIREDVIRWINQRNIRADVFIEDICRVINPEIISCAPRWLQYLYKRNYKIIVPLYDVRMKMISFACRLIGVHDADNPKTRFLKGISTKGLMMHNRKSSKDLIITEGIPDYLSLAHENYSIIGIPSSGSLNKSLYEKFNNWENIYICTDNDATGNRYAKMIIENTSSVCHRFLPTTDINSIPDISVEKIIKEAKKVEIGESQPDISYVLSCELLIEHYNDSRNLIYIGKDNYWEYDGIHWKPSGKHLVENQILQKIEDSKEKIYDGKKNIAKIIGEMGRIVRAKISNPIDFFGIDSETRSIVNCRNKEIWINEKSGKFDAKNHQPESYLHFCIDVDYNKTAKCKLWLKTLHEIFDNHQDTSGTILFLQELFGYTIQCNKNIAMWVLFKGGGNNGKSLVLSILGRLLGNSALEKSIGEFNLERNPHALEDLPGKLAVIDDDVQSHTIIPDGIIKKISENKIMTANAKYLKSMKFKNSAIIYLAANGWPISRDLSKGMSRRANVVPFSRHFEPHEVDLYREIDIAKTEMNGILNWALEGLQRLRQRGSFNPSTDCIDAKNEWLINSSQLKHFIDDCCLVDPVYAVYKTQLWSCYWEWSQDQRINKPYNKRGFDRAIKESGFEEKTVKGGLWGRGIQNYIGIKCKEENEAW